MNPEPDGAATTAAEEDDDGDEHRHRDDFGSQGRRRAATTTAPRREDNMMMGTDYGHHDHAADLEGLRNLKTAGGISARVYDKIVDANPRAAYAL